MKTISSDPDTRKAVAAIKAELERVKADIEKAIQTLRNLPKV